MSEDLWILLIIQLVANVWTFWITLIIHCNVFIYVDLSHFPRLNLL